MRDRSLLAYIYDCLVGCPGITDLVDADRGVRRVMQPERGGFDVCLCFGNTIGNPISGFEAEAVREVNVTFIAYARKDASVATAGDLLVGDILHWLERVFGCHQCTQDCCPPAIPTDLIVLNSRYDGDVYEANLYPPLQAWRKACRYRFKVVYQCCRPGQPAFIR
jgi:hypothetical protein